MKYGAVEALAAIAFLALVAGAAPGHAQDCQVDLGRGWATGTGQGRIVMKNTGVGCTAVLIADPDSGASTIDDMRITLRPQNGAVTVAPPRVTYTPNPGFRGMDNFGLTARGLGRSGQPISLRGDVTVEVR